MGNPQRYSGCRFAKGRIATTSRLGEKRGKMMKITSITSIFVLVLMASAVQVVSADTYSAQKVELESVYISSLLKDPEVLFPYVFCKFLAFEHQLDT